MTLSAYSQDNNGINSPSVYKFTKLDVGTFLEQVISQKRYVISELEKEIGSNSSYYNLLLNKALRFKIFLDIQEFETEFYSKNCSSIAEQIKIHKLLFRNKFSNGIENLNFLYGIAIENDESIQSRYNQILESQKKEFIKLMDASDQKCNNFLSVLKSRIQGNFNDEELSKNILSFNYIANPVRELLDKHYQEFSSLHNAPDEDFFITAKLPRSWKINDKNDYVNASTVAVIEPYEDYLNGVISFSFYKKFTPKGFDENEYTDNDLADVLYNNDEALQPIIHHLNKELNKDNKIKMTLFQIGNKKHILYVTENKITNGLFPNQKIKSLHSISFNNKKLIKMSYSGSFSSNEFNSFSYYSKVFLKILTSIKYRALNEDTIYLSNNQGMRFLSTSINGKDYEFLLDTGATNIVINKPIHNSLLENGFITQDDYLGKSIALIADGNTVECENWMIPELRIGNRIIKNINVSVINSESSIPIFGMNGLDKLGVKKINLKENEIILINK